MTRTEAEVEICNELGLHLRAAAAFVKVAEKFRSEIQLERDGQTANGKSIISLVTLAATQGTPVRVIAEGPDADAAAAELVALVRDRFGEGR